jgi:uncharacterized protein
MPLTDTNFGASLPIDGYGPGFFRVGGVVYPGGVLVRADQACHWGGLEDRAPLMDLAGHVDVLFMGMGAEIAHAPADLRADLEAVGVMIEAMASPTAARTYNVLLSEGRRVAVALIALPAAT